MKHLVINTSITVRITDLNYGAHLGHIELLGLCHEARMQFIKQFDSNFDELNLFGGSIVISDVNMKIINESFYGDQLNITVSPIEYSKTSLTLQHSVEKQANQEVTAEVTTKMVFVNELGKPTRMPEALMTLLVTPDTEA